MVILAGGSGTRFETVAGGSSKVYQILAGRPILSYSLELAATSGLVDRVVVVIREEDRQLAQRLVDEWDLGGTLVVGGASRHASETNALEALAPAIEAGIIDLVAVHDGARPFVTRRLLAATIEAAVRNGGAVPGRCLEGVVVDTHSETLVDADTLFQVQTPQVFRATPTLAAFRRATRTGFEGVDTAETVQRFSDLAVVIEPGDPDNLKLTYPADKEVAQQRAAGWPPED